MLPGEPNWVLTHQNLMRSCSKQITLPPTGLMEIRNFMQNIINRGKRHIQGQGCESRAFGILKIMFYCIVTIETFLMPFASKLSFK